MGLLDSITQMAGQFSGNPEHGAVAGGLVQEMQNMPGGPGGILSAFQQNGLGGLAQQMAQGQTAPIAPGQVEQGLGGTGIIDSIAQRTGMSPGTVKMALAVLLPIVIHHLISNGHVTPDGQPGPTPMPESGGLLQSILGKLV